MKKLRIKMKIRFTLGERSIMESLINDFVLHHITHYITFWSYQTHTLWWDIVSFSPYFCFKLPPWCGVKWVLCIGCVLVLLFSTKIWNTNMFIILYLWEDKNRIMFIMCNSTLRYTNNFDFDSLCVLVNINTIYPDTLSFLNSIPISSKRFNM